MTETRSITRLLCALLASSLAFQPLLHAEEKPEPGSEEKEKEKPAEAGSAVRVTTFLLAHKGVPDQATVPIMRALDDGLKRNTRLEMKDLDTRLADFAQEVPQEQVDEGRALLADGHKALTGLELGVAIKKLVQAVDVLSKVLPYIKKQELADAMMALGSAQFEQGDKKASRATLLRLLVWRNDYRLDTGKYPPAMIAPLEEARHEMEKLKRGSLEIRSEPVAAQAYVDGKYVGVTPTFAEGLAAGEHWVTLKREGYRKAVGPATVSPRVQQVATLTLEHSGKYLLVEQALTAVEKSIGGDSLDPASETLKEVLFLDHAVFVRVAAQGPGALQIDAMLYDVRIKKRLARVTRTVPTAEAEKQLNTLASQLYEKVDYEAELETPKDAPPPKAIVRRKFYKTWWFWSVIGVVAAGVAVGVGVGVTQAPKGCGGTTIGDCVGFVF